MAGVVISQLGRNDDLTMNFYTTKINYAMLVNLKSGPG